LKIWALFFWGGEGNVKQSDKVEPNTLALSTVHHHLDIASLLIFETPMLREKTTREDNQLVFFDRK
jgi:hypothetical protein